MSLPPATRDISNNPAKSSVIDPVNKTAQAADVDRKLRLYGVIDAFRKGRMPSNVQIDQTLDYVLNNSPVTVDKLSPEGKRLIHDLRDITDTAKLMVQDKNADELFQNFVWHTQIADKSSLKPGDLSGALPVDGEKAKSDGDQAVRHLRTLLTLILTNSEVRKLLSDFSVIGRDLLAKGAAKAAGAIAPTEEALRNVDQSAPNDQFVTKGGHVAGNNETPVLEGQMPFTNKTVGQHPKEDTAFVKNEDGTRRPAGDVVQEGREQYQDLRQQGHQMGDQTTSRAQQDVQEHREADSSDDTEAKKQGMVGKMRQMRDNVRDGLSDRIPQQHRDKARDQLERGKKFLNEEYFPEERRDQFIFRGKKVIIECQKHDDYQESIRWLLSYLEEYIGHGRHAGDSLQSDARKRPTDRNLKLTILELRTLLERFANGISMDIIFDAMNALIDDAQRDPELRQWFTSVDNYMRKVLLEPGYVLEPDCNSQASHLRESGRQFYDVKYRGHFDNLFSSTGNWFNAMGQDPLNKRFGEDWARLTRDLLFDSEGSLKFKPDLWNDLRRVIMPQLIERVGYIPIPRIEYTDDALDLVVENLTLQGRNLFPNIVALEAHNFVKFSPYDAIQDDSHHRITLTLEQMQADMRDVAFYYRKKTGIPKMNDSGLADVLIGGRGLSAVIVLVSTRRDHSSVFKVEDVHVKVDNLKFSIRDSKHDFLYKTLRPLATGLIKRQIQKAIRDALTTGLEYVDGQLVAVRDRMASAKATEGESRTEVLKDLFSRSKSPKEDSSITSGGTSSSHSQFKIVADKRNSILGNAGNPSGWANRATEKKEIASQGHEWRSDAFTIIDPEASHSRDTKSSTVAHAEHTTSQASNRRQL